MVKVHEVFAYLRVRGAADAIDFYERAFDAHEVFRLAEPGGRIGHAEIKIGDTVLMLADEYPEHGILGPQTLGGTTIAIHLHVDDGYPHAASDERGRDCCSSTEGSVLRRAIGEHWDPFGHE